MRGRAKGVARDRVVSRGRNGKKTSPGHFERDPRASVLPERFFPAQKVFWRIFRERLPPPGLEKSPSRNQIAEPARLPFSPQYPERPECCLKHRRAKPYNPRVAPVQGQIAPESLRDHTSWSRKCLS